jgi:hypothetical protein
MVKEVPEVSAIEATSPQLPYQEGEGSLAMDRAVPDLSAAIDDTPPQSTDEEVVNVDGFTDIVSRDSAEQVDDYILNSSIHVYRRSISRSPHFMLPALEASEWDSVGGTRGP